MKKLNTILIALFGLAGVAQAQLPANRMLVTFKPELAEQISVAREWQILDSLCQSYKNPSIHALHKGNKGGHIYALQFAEGINISETIRAYQQTGYFKYVSADATGSVQGTTASAPNDTLFHRQWALHNDGSFDSGRAKAGADINLLKAWDVEEGDTSVLVAVIDAGLRLHHADFEGRLWRNPADQTVDSADDDNNGYIDDTLGWNFVTNTQNDTDDHGHGTLVAGIIGANANNTTGYAGVDKHCRMMICKAVNEQGLFYYSWLVEALYYAVDNGAQILNLSLGGYIDLPELHDAIKYAADNKVFIVAGMGNIPSTAKMYPAAYPEAFAVGATGCTDTTWSQSSFGDHIAVVAPGENISGPSHLNDTGSVMWSGTSFATPHVTGIAALLLAQDKTRTPAQLRSLIQSNADDMVGSAKDVPGWDKYYGYGRVNAHRALINAAVSVPDTKNEKGFTLYPVPASDVLHINAPDMASAAVTITNISGTVIYTGYLSANGNASLSVKHLAPGNYILTLGKDDARVSHKWVKQ